MKELQQAQAQKRCDRKQWDEQTAKRWARDRSAKWNGMAERADYVAEECSDCGAWHVRRVH